MSPTPPEKPRRPRRWSALWLIAGICCLMAIPVPAQEAQEDEPAPMPTGNAGLVMPGKPGFSVPFTITPDGPRFALAPLAAALGVELRIGPIGESHTLIFGDKKILVGPDRALMVTVSTDGKDQEEVLSLSGLPMRDAQGLKVPIDFLERSFGEHLNYQFAWDSERLRLEITRPEARELDGSIDLRHQYGFSIVEIQLSDRPRYRVEREPGALVIQLIGDRLRAPRQA